LSKFLPLLKKIWAIGATDPTTCVGLDERTDERNGTCWTGNKATKDGKGLISKKMEKDSSQKKMENDSTME
jgi:hypothetical protein